ncbi:FAD-binding oxidoreductase [Cellulomonas telluris]|uniref:FAD-binding oxidoreductase n=1 Tax=Cellulomonas telluris TaxID=2306636 RepID=UPI0010A85829|nr:FAD-binding oxidoreductase [Cellulomonas telluris]
MIVEGVEGPVLTPGQDGFEEERTGFNLAVRHRPDVVVGATTPADVAAAVRHAAARGWAVAVQGTGHGASVPLDGGLLVSTRRMAEVGVEPSTRTARVDAGARSGQVVEAAAVHGLAPLNGSAPHVGVVGYTLGGGLPLLGRSHGWAADRVRALEVVTADGRQHRVGPDDELFGGLLGGRDNVGIVTAMEFELVPITELYGGGLFFDAERVPGLLEGYVAWAADLPRSMNTSLALVPFPDDPVLPEPMRGRRVYHVRIACTAGPGVGELLVQPLRELGPRLLDTLAVLPYRESASIHDDPPVPMPWAADNAMLTGLDSRAIATLLAHVRDEASVPTIVELRRLGGALADAGPHASLVGHRSAAYMLAVLTPLEGPDTQQAHRVLGRLFEDLTPWTTGRFLNFMGHGPHADHARTRTAYEPADLERLARLKALHDSANTFRANTNVLPVADPAPEETA